MIRLISILSLTFLIVEAQSQSLDLNLATAEKLCELPLHCITQEYPNKLGQVLTDSTHIQSPKELHPVFYGCFDWHSSVHGHWLMAAMMNKFPESELAKTIQMKLEKQFTIPKVQKELLYFQPKLNKSFERTYGWAWLLKLQSELIQSENESALKWSKNLESLVNEIEKNYTEFLPKMVYPIRVGEHTNTAFGLSLALDYARISGHKEFEELIISRSKDFYLKDEECPLIWEPSGFDFISPCLQEAELMSKVLNAKEYEKWLKGFLPQLFEKNFELAPGKVLDRTDGKLVHLDGLNFSRAWCFYTIAKQLPKYKNQFKLIGDKHINASFQYVMESDYMGSHWLASFLTYALIMRENV